MAIKITNNAYGILAAGISATDTTISVGSGEGARFPSLGVGDYFYATLIDTSNNLEIVKVTGRAINTMTVVRGQDSTIARVYALGSRLELRPVAAVFNEKADVTYVDAQDAILDAGKLDHVAPGAAGNVLTSNGLDWVSQTPVVPSGGIYKNTQYFTTVGTATYTPTPGTTFVVVEVIGGGGGGTSAGGQSSFAGLAVASGGGIAANNPGVGTLGDINTSGSRGQSNNYYFVSQFGSTATFSATGGTGFYGFGNANRVSVTTTGTGGIDAPHGGGYSRKKISVGFSGATITVGGLGSGGSFGTSGAVFVHEYA